MRKWDWAVSKTVNPRPATGPGVLTVDQLKTYLRAFRHDPRYGICGVRGGWGAFARACGDSSKYLNRLVPESPQNVWIPAWVQATLSRKVRQVLSGQLYILEEAQGVRWCIEPNPKPLNVAPLQRNHRLYIDHTAIGPRIKKIQTDF